MKTKLIAALAAVLLFGCQGEQKAPSTGPTVSLTSQCNGTAEGEVIHYTRTVFSDGSVTSDCLVGDGGRGFAVYPYDTAGAAGAVCTAQVYRDNSSVEPPVFLFRLINVNSASAIFYPNDGAAPYETTIACVVTEEGK